MLKGAVQLLATCFLVTGPAYAQLTGLVIGVDPGHGGADSGAIGPMGLRESDVNLSTALLLKQYLEADGATVLMTRTSNVLVSLSSRSSYLNSNGADRAISVHHNSVSDPSVNRTMNFVFCGFCFALAGDLASAIIQRLGMATGLPLGPAAATPNVICNGGFSCGRQGVGQANFHMVRETAMPAVLVEVSFISNPGEETRLTSMSYLDGNAWAIGAGAADSNSSDVDSDGDGVLDDGDGSGIVGDHQCVAGANAVCDDNCRYTYNPDQADSGGILSAIGDGIGDACQCGDVNDDGSVGPADIDAFRFYLANPIGFPLSPVAESKCTLVDEPHPCNILDGTVLRRALAVSPLAPGIAPICEAAKGA